LNPEEVLKEVAEQTSRCTRCKLHHSRKKAVPGAGHPASEIMFIGEGPGFHENEQGLPFVGAAGKFLDELLGEAGLTRDEVFITNVVKCRPPSNRDPSEEELEACRYYLERQIAAIDPDVVVTLGRVSMGYFIKNVKISDVHGMSFFSHGRMVVPMYHPAAALHQPSLRDVVKGDFARLPDYVTKAQETSQANPDLLAERAQIAEEHGVDENGPEQMPLF